MKDVEFVVSLDEMNPYSKINSMLSFEFHKYVMENTDIANKIPKNALIIFQINGEEEFNKWSTKTSMRNREENQPVITVKLKKWREASILEELEVSEAA